MDNILTKYNPTNIQTASDEDLGLIMDRTEYAHSGVAVGELAARDQDLRHAARSEQERRMFGDDGTT